MLTVWGEIMQNAMFNQDWYGTQAKIVSQNANCVVVDYGCNGRGIVKNYNLFEGIQLCFLDFETDGAMKAQKFNPDIIQITHCQTGRYECEFANHTVSYLPEGYFSVAESICRFLFLFRWENIMESVLS